jgi:hypothetical protein
MEADLIEAAEEEEDFVEDEVVVDTTVLKGVIVLTDSKAIAKHWKVVEIKTSHHKTKQTVVIMTIEIVGLLRQTTKRVVDYLVVKILKNQLVKLRHQISSARIPVGTKHKY